MTDETVNVPGLSPEGERVVAVGSHAFSESAVKHVFIDEDITEISGAAFLRCSSPEDAVCRSVKTVGTYAFRG